VLFRSQDGGTLAIRTWFDQTAQAVRVDISDTGRGISDEVMNKMFQPFFTTKTKGSGLGLAISKRLIEDHGGSIGIERNACGGTTFTISLPVDQSERVHTT
jgi:signal transduction histidine kinase